MLCTLFHSITKNINPIPINPPRKTLTTIINDRFGADFSIGTFTGSIIEKAGVSFFTEISAFSFLFGQTRINLRSQVVGTTQFLVADSGTLLNDITIAAAVFKKGFTGSFEFCPFLFEARFNKLKILCRLPGFVFNDVFLKQFNRLFVLPGQAIEQSSYFIQPPNNLLYPAPIVLLYSGLLTFQDP